MTELELGTSTATARRRPTIGSVAGWGVFGILAILFLVFRPTILGGTTHYLFVSGSSMEPGMRTGDLAILVPAAAYAVGDVVAYHPVQAPTGTIIHRIVGGDATSGFVIRGDNRDTNDYDRPTSGALLGRMVLHLPAVGWALDALRQPVVFGGIAAVLVVACAWELMGRRPKKPS
ncbi:MAG: hypothetical protein RL338_575 [Chloroflexota bacterium]